MKKVLALAAVALIMCGCSFVQPRYNKLHEDVFGCPPVGQEPTRELNAEGPRDEVKRDFLGNPCGQPVYKKPDCPDCGVKIGG